MAAVVVSRSKRTLAFLIICTACFPIGIQAYYSGQVETLSPTEIFGQRWKPKWKDERNVGVCHSTMGDDGRISAIGVVNGAKLNPEYRFTSDQAAVDGHNVKAVMFYASSKCSTEVTDQFVYIRFKDSYVESNGIRELLRGVQLANFNLMPLVNMDQFYSYQELGQGMSDYREVAQGYMYLFKYDGRIKGWTEKDRQPLIFPSENSVLQDQLANDEAKPAITVLRTSLRNIANEQVVERKKLEDLKRELMGNKDAGNNTMTAQIGDINNFGGRSSQSLTTNLNPMNLPGGLEKSRSDLGSSKHPFKIIRNKPRPRMQDISGGLFGQALRDKMAKFATQPLREFPIPALQSESEIQAPSRTKKKSGSTFGDLTIPKLGPILSKGGTAFGQPSFERLSFFSNSDNPPAFQQAFGNINPGVPSGPIFGNLGNLGASAENKPTGNVYQPVGQSASVFANIGAPSNNQQSGGMGTGNSKPVASYSLGNLVPSQNFDTKYPNSQRSGLKRGGSMLDRLPSDDRSRGDFSKLLSEGLEKKTKPDMGLFSNYIPPSMNTGSTFNTGAKNNLDLDTSSTFGEDKVVCPKMGSPEATSTGSDTIDLLDFSNLPKNQNSREARVLRDCYEDGIPVLGSLVTLPANELSPSYGAIFMEHERLDRELNQEWGPYYKRQEDAYKKSRQEESVRLYGELAQLSARQGALETEMSSILKQTVDPEAANAPMSQQEQQQIGRKLSGLRENMIILDIQVDSLTEDIRELDDTTNSAIRDLRDRWTSKVDDLEFRFKLWLSLAKQNIEQKAAKRREPQ